MKLLLTFLFLLIVVDFSPAKIRLARPRDMSFFCLKYNDGEFIFGCSQMKGLSRKTCSAYRRLVCNNFWNVKVSAAPVDKDVKPKPHRSHSNEDVLTTTNKKTEQKPASNQDIPIEIHTTATNRNKDVKPKPHNSLSNSNPDLTNTVKRKTNSKQESSTEIHTTAVHTTTTIRNKYPSRKVQSSVKTNYTREPEKIPQNSNSSDKIKSSVNLVSNQSRTSKLPSTFVDNSNQRPPSKLGRLPKVESSVSSSSDQPLPSRPVTRNNLSDDDEPLPRLANNKERLTVSASRTSDSTSRNTNKLPKSQRSDNKSHSLNSSRTNTRFSDSRNITRFRNSRNSASYSNNRNKFSPRPAKVATANSNSTVYSSSKKKQKVNAIKQVSRISGSFNRNVTYEQKNLQKQLFEETLKPMNSTQ